MEMWNLTRALLRLAARRFLKSRRQRRRKPSGRCRSRTKTPIGGSECRACIPACSGKAALLARCAVNQGIELADEIARWVAGHPLPNVPSRGLAHFPEAT